METKPEPTRKWMLPRLALGLVQAAIFLAAWFGLAGKWDWWRGWVFFGIFIVYTGLLAGWLAIADPDLLRERNQPGENVEPWDRALMAVYVVLMLALLAIAALDNGRFGWSQVSPGLTALGWGLIAITGAIVWHVMAINRYLSSYARLQPERGQVVISRGLYGLIRHPMYLGIILAILGMPLVLGSLWALAPALLISALQIYRTAREDRMLQDGLDGYREYCLKVAWRLVPGIW
jgi:protein-S-isoprenylcysteine O-methyltransferase Ste14